MGGPYITVAVSHDDGNGVTSISTAGEVISIQLSMYFASAEWWDSPGDGPICNMLIRTYSELEPLEGGWLDTDRAEDHDGGAIALAYELKDIEIVDGCSGEIEDPTYANLASDMLNHWWSIGIHELSTVETEWYKENRDDFDEGYAVGIGWTTDAIDNYMPYGWAYAYQTNPEDDGVYTDAEGYVTFLPTFEVFGPLGVNPVYLQGDSVYWTPVDDEYPFRSSAPPTTGTTGVTSTTPTSTTTTGTTSTGTTSTGTTSTGTTSTGTTSTGTTSTGTTSTGTTSTGTTSTGTMDAGDLMVLGSGFSEYEGMTAMIEVREASSSTTTTSEDVLDRVSVTISGGVLLYSWADVLTGSNITVDLFIDTDGDASCDVADEPAWRHLLAAPSGDVTVGVAPTNDTSADACGTFE